jgi:hypothetical protein
MRRVLRFVVPIAAILAATSSAAQAASFTDNFFETDRQAGQFFSADGGDCTGTNLAGTASDAISGQVLDTHNNAMSCDNLTYLITVTGYTNPPDTALNAALTLYVQDNTDPGQNPETIIVQLNDLAADGSPYTITGLSFNVDVTANIDPTDGSLKVYLQVGSKGSGQADFIFNGSVLNATWTDGDAEPNPNSAPEPVTMLLMGGGLAAAGLRRRFAA